MAIRRPVRAALVCVCLSWSVAASAGELTVRPEIGTQVGHETFELQAEIPNASATATVKGRSKLTYPINTTLVGATATLDAGSISWSLSGHTNVHDPWGSMVDQDFLGVRSGGAESEVEFSHTDSRSTMRWYAADLALRIRLVELQVEPALQRLLLVVGFRYESSNYDVFGVRGWQLDGDGNRVTVSLPDATRVGHYETRQKTPFLGFRFDGVVGERLSIGSEARFLMSISSHDDDHLLRHKTAHAAPFGIGASFGLEPAYEVYTSDTMRAFLGLDLQFFVLTSTSGTLSQKYYADDPYIAGDQTMEKIPDASFGYTVLRGRFLAFFAIKM